MYKSSIIILFVCFVSCNTTPSNENKTVPTENSVDKCYAEISIDTSKLKLGHVANLDIYNGIRNYKFGELKTSYQSCLEIVESNSKIDTCKIKSSINFLDNEWNGNVYFLDGKLCRIELDESNPYLTATYNKLSSLFGRPNLQPIKVINSNFKTATPLIVGNDKRQFKPYSETLNEILKSFTETKSNSSTDIFTEYNENKNEWLLNNKRYSYDGDPIRVNIKYFPQVDIESIWESKTVLQLLVSRSTELEVGQPSSMSGGESKLQGGYRIIPHHYVKVNFFDSKKTMELFKQLEKEAERNINTQSNQQKAQDEKEILKKF